MAGCNNARAGCVGATAIFSENGAGRKRLPRQPVRLRSSHAIKPAKDVGVSIVFVVVVVVLAVLVIVVVALFTRPYTFLLAGSYTNAGEERNSSHQFFLGAFLRGQDFKDS